MSATEGGGQKSVTIRWPECPIKIILIGMTYYHHWFEEFVISIHYGVVIG